jgi:uncharacterized protein YecE (DUF72 family)
MRENNLRIGTAGWTIPRQHAPKFPEQGTHLERYARCLNAVEINSSFYRSHKVETYIRWADSTPTNFRFAVKAPRLVTHERRLKDPSPLTRFAEETVALGDKLGLWLLQLPPSLEFNPVFVERFFQSLRARFDGNLVCEPRHVSWFTPEADRLLTTFRVARAAADPAVSPRGTKPGGWDGLVYYRLHGSPKMYVSAYSNEFLEAFALTIKEAAKSMPVWCIFNNTAAGAAIQNALTLSAYAQS